ncbi:MAG: PQQ-binding-like beta-propeller repeat protein [Fimbriimonas sp.]
MISRKSAWQGTLAALTLVMAAASFGQVVGDFPTYSGSNARLGHNGNPNNTGPGQAFLHWFDPPITFNPTEKIWEPVTITMDNTDTANTRRDFPAQGPFDPVPYGGRVVSQWYTPLLPPNPAINWAWPQIGEEASFPFLVPVRRVGLPPPPDPVVYPANLDYRFPAYLYTKVTPSLSYAEPTKAKDPNDLRSIRYTFFGKPGEERNYAMYVWLPVGPTGLSGTTTFPQRYYVFEVKFGPNAAQRYIDIVDTYASGGGWVRLGNGGAVTNQVFPWDGTNPIHVYLYNTVPRYSDGTLTMPHAANNENDVKRFIVYSDGVQAVPAKGSYQATPISARQDPTQANTQMLVDAKNELSVSRGTNRIRTVEKGVVSSRFYDIPTKSWITRWRYSPAEETGTSNRIVDNSAAAWTADFVPNTTSTRYAGDDVLVSNLVFTATTPVPTPPTGTVTYQTALEEGSYEVFAYLPGDNNGLQFGRQVQYQIQAEGGFFDYVIDQSQARGWVRIGDRRFRHTTANPLRLILTNGSTLAADSTRLAYADAVKFVGDKNQSISSSPIYATARIMKTGGLIQDTQVVMIADEDGRIHCLDATGKGDGTTTEYWAYPSTKDPDPNHTFGEDGVGGIAEMPLGFELSTGLVQRVGTEDFFYIGSRNGRVYCINMLGRGDYTATAAGTTTRKWTFPSTYPDPNAIPTSSLGSFRGSLSYGTTSNGPRIFVPTTQGRLYALDARGGGNNKTTTVAWTFPKLTATPPETVPPATLGEIWMTPSYFRSIANDITTAKVFFGTAMKNDEPGRFFSLNANTGTVIWELGKPNPAMPALNPPADTFLASPSIVTYKLLQNNAAAPNGGVVYVVNQNRFVYAIDADTGTILWQTDELGVGARGALTFERMMVYDINGILNPAPVIMVPTLDGRFSGLFADMTINRFGSKRAWEYVAAGETITASIANAHGWMFGADSLGYLYAWNNFIGGYPGDQQFPGEETLTENNRTGDIFRKAKMKFITRDAYVRLRLPPGDPQHLPYLQAIAAANANDRSVFEWGETVYVLVYDFPYKLTASDDTTPVPPPIVNISFNVEGAATRSIPVPSRQFDFVANGNPPKLKEIEPELGLPAPPEGDLLVDGYAILPFPFQGGGANALPPGRANVAFSITSQSLNNNGAQQTVALRPDLNRKSFQMANPLAISTKDGNVNPSEPYPSPDSTSNFTMGYDINPSKPERTSNGTTGVKALLGKSTGMAQHGLTKSTTIYVYDVSMMGLLRPDGMGLENVRVARQDLERQGGTLAVYKALNSTFYPLFEDLPVNSPNTSIDYPDIARENIRVTKDPNGDSENPLFNGVQLRAARIKTSPTTSRPMQEGDVPFDPSGATTRLFQPIPLQIDVDIPKYQPPVDLSKNPTAAIPNSEGQTWNSGYQQGYMGRFNVFVDSFQNGNLDLAQREPYRSLNLATAVAPDERLAVNTPSIELGSLATGAGFSAFAMPGFGFNPLGATDNRVFQPWAGLYSQPDSVTGGLRLFKEFNVQNLGNVNMTNLRVAKAYDFSDSKPRGTAGPWQFFSQANDSLAWLEGGWNTNSLYSGNLWSDLDWQFSPWAPGVNPDRNVILQKPRVTDRVPTTLTVNPKRRQNPNINARDSVLFTRKDASGNLLFPARNPRVAVTVPIGFPSGRYVQKMRVIEDTKSPSQDLTPTWSNVLDGSLLRAETASDPTFDVLFTVRESRLTNSYTPGTDRMIDDVLPGGTTTTTAYANQMPAGIRDAFGSLLLAWVSNRPNWAADNGGTANPDNPYRIYIATLDSQWSFTNASMSGPAGASAPLRDLNNWIAPNAGRWWRREVQNFPPGNPNALFSVGTGESIITSTIRYTNPSFPALGMKDPFDRTTTYTGTYLGFVGSAQKSTPSGVATDSRIMMSVITTAQDGSVTAAAPAVLPADPQMAKGKPSIVQTDTGAMIFFAGVAGGQSRIYYSRLDNAGFNPISALPFGSGFDTVSAPSTVGRRYRNIPNVGVVEMTFAGRLRGRPYNEVFIGRLVTSEGSEDRLTEFQDRTLDPQRAFVWLPWQTDERIVAEGNGVYRSRGVVWNLTSAGRNLILQQLSNGVRTNVLLDGYDNLGNYTAANDTRAYDAQTGIISYDSRLGGKVYIDPNLGTVRFTGGLPQSSAELLLSYQARFFRVNSAGTSAYSGPTGVFDSRLISDISFWRNSSNAPAGANDALRNDRMFFTYNRAPAGTNTAARPAMSSFRLGIRLPYRIATQNGAPVNFQVTTAHSGYQMDPAQGKVYFMAEDEDKLMTVTYTGVDSDGRTVGPITIQSTVSYVGERAEEEIPVEQAVNESGLSTFLEPFNYLNDRRPPLVWLFWTSTRSGNPDLYFQTIAPQWAPITVGTGP